MCLVIQSCPTVCDPMTVTHQAPLSMGILQAKILKWVAMPSSRESSQPRGQTQVSCITGGFFTIWATRKPISSLLMFMYYTEFIRRNKASIESTTGPVVGIIIIPLHPKISTFKSPKTLKMLPYLVKDLCRSNKESWNGRIYWVMKINLIKSQGSLQVNEGSKRVRVRGIEIWLL